MPDLSPKAISPWRFIGRYRARVTIGCVMLVATTALALTIPYFLGRTVEALRGPSPATAIPPLALTIVALAIGQAVTRILSRVSLFNAARMAEYDLRSQLFGHLLCLDSEYFRANPSGDLMSRLTNDVQSVRAMWGPGVLNIVNTTFMFLVALTLMLSIDVTLTLWALIPYPAMVALGSLFGRRIYRTSRAVQEQLGLLSSRIQEDLTGIGTIRAYSLEGHRESGFASASEILRDRNMALTRVRGQLAPVLGGVASLGTVAVLWFGGVAVIEGRIDLGQLVQFNAYLALLVWPTLALGWMISMFQRGMASWGRLQTLLQTEPSIRDGSGPPLPRAESAGRIDIRGLTVDIGEHRILDSVDLTAKAGAVIAIVGRTGSGKTTLVECLPRLVDVPAGVIFLDDRDITDVPLEDLRLSIGYAPQEAFLFSTTIAENIAMGVDRSGERLSAQERQSAIEAAAAAAGLNRDIAAFPNGLDTVVGERGITLSGGQRQRVALARALATRPRVLILDDSLSSVDAETEREILTELRSQMAGRTALIISHRVGAVRSADSIVVLDHGRIIERGTHDELIARGGTYRELYESQLEQEVA